MKKSVIVTIERLENKVVVSNDYGKKWVIPFELPYNDDISIKAVVADAAAHMLIGTIASQLRHCDARTLKYTLTIDTI